MSDTEQRSKRHAVLYFSPKNSDAYKELAARVRSDGGRTTLVWSDRWKGAESILTECRAIIIEKGCPNDTAIQEAYRRYAVDCEIHFADANGEFEEATDTADPQTVIVEDIGDDLEKVSRGTLGDGIEPDDTTESVDDEEEGATNEESDTDSDAASDSVVEAEDCEICGEPADSCGHVEDDDGPSKLGGPEGQEGTSDSERVTSD